MQEENINLEKSREQNSPFLTDFLTLNEEDDDLSLFGLECSVSTNSNLSNTANTLLLPSITTTQITSRFTNQENLSSITQINMQSNQGNNETHTL